MNSYPNNDCKQCTESKLGRVHSVHTQDPGFAHAALRPRAQGRVAGHTGRVTTRIGRVAGRVACCAAHCVSRHVATRPRSLLRVSQCFYVVSQSCHRARKRCCAMSQPVSLPPVTIQNIILRHTPLARPRVRAAAHLCAQAGCVAAPSVRVAVPGRRVKPPCCAPLCACALLCHDIVFYIVTQHQNGQ